MRSENSIWDTIGSLGLSWTHDCLFSWIRISEGNLLLVSLYLGFYFFVLWKRSSSYIDCCLKRSYRVLDFFFVLLCRLFSIILIDFYLIFAFNYCYLIFHCGLCLGSYQEILLNELVSNTSRCFFHIPSVWGNFQELSPCTTSVLAPYNKWNWRCSLRKTRRLWLRGNCFLNSIRIYFLTYNTWLSSKIYPQNIHRIRHRWWIW